MAAALSLVLRRNGAKPAYALIKSAFDLRGIPSANWVVLAPVIMPVAFALIGGMVWLSGTALPTLQPLLVHSIILAFVLFYLGAIGEEIGWQGYAYPCPNQRHSALTAALIIGAVWALWHVTPFALQGRSVGWILWHRIAMVLMRVLIGWLVVNAGRSIAVAVLFHMMSNSIWGIFSDFGPYYDPMFLCAALMIPVIAAIILCGKNLVMRFQHF